MYAGAIISKIDELILGSSLTDKRFIPRLFAGLVQQIPVSNRDGTKVIWMPCKLNGLNDAVQIVPDDAYNIITYHRLISNVYGTRPAANQFGDDYEEETSTSDVIMIVIGFNKKLMLEAEQLEALIASNFPGALENIFVNDLQMSSVTIQKTSSSFDAVAIFSQEYRGERDFIKQDMSLFQIRYRIESAYRKGCFTLCEDCEESYVYGYTGGTPAACPEEITNGGFVGNADGWVVANLEPLPAQGWSYGTNNVIHDGVVGNTANLIQVGILVEGASYTLTCNIGGTTGTVIVAFDLGDWYEEFPAGAGDITFTGIWSMASGWKVQFHPSSDFDGTISNVSVKAVSC